MRYDMMRKTLLGLLASAAISIPFSAVQAQRGGDDALQMVSIDVEGGGGTLFVTPDHHSLLIDTGNPEGATRITGDNPSSARIEKAAHELGISKIDYLITTHYHSDHIGGLEGLMKRMPIGTFID